MRKQFLIKPLKVLAKIFIVSSVTLIAAYCGLFGTIRGYKRQSVDDGQLENKDSSAKHFIFESEEQLTNQDGPFTEDEDAAFTNVSLFQSNPDIKTILLWNHFSLKADFGLDLGTQAFESMKCPKICNLTNDRRYLPIANSIVVHPFHLFKDLKNVVIPPRASREQIIMFMLLENPYRSQPGLANLPYNDVFNLTLSYLDDPQTDLYNPYGQIRPRSQPAPSAVPTKAHIEGKTKSVAWLLSNCHAPSARYEYANLLSKHIDVDIFGKCGNSSCPRGLNCTTYLNTHYLFYLAFENGFCRDYITEKTFRTLRDTTMVPIVLGRANYTKLLPKNSFISVRDYKSPKALAQYLEYLSKNRDEYMKYHEWKSDYEVATVQKLKYENFCKLCVLLNNSSYPFKSNFNAYEYWNPSDCLLGDEERKAVHIT